MFYWLTRILSIILFKGFFGLTVNGAENIPARANFIVAANHESFFDPFILSAAIPRKINWITRKGFFNISLLRWFLFRLKAIPSGKSSQKAVDLLLKDKTVGLFPEGTRTFDGKLREFRRGAALLAMKTGRPILPCAIIGAYRAFPRTRIFPRFCRITVRIGKPVYLLKEFEEELDDVNMQTGMFKVRTEIKEMLNAGI